MAVKPYSPPRDTWHDSKQDAIATARENEREAPERDFRRWYALRTTDGFKVSYLVTERLPHFGAYWNAQGVQHGN